MTRVCSAVLGTFAKRQTSVVDALAGGKDGDGRSGIPTPWLGDIEPEEGPLT